MKKRKGFTLVEVLAVISVLAVIAIIATPIIINVLDNAKKNTFKSSVDGIIRIIKNDVGNTNYEGDTYTILNGTIKNSKGKKISSSGGTDENGKAVIDADGKITVAIYNNKWCAHKNYDDSITAIKEYKENECEIIVPVLAYQMITDKCTSGNKEGLLNDDFGNARYSGNNSVVKNYVRFNNEVWRIIGIFGGNMVKLVKDDIIPNPGNLTNPDTFLWNISNINDWNISDLQNYLNTGYYDQLRKTSKNMIATAKYTIGSIYNTNITKYVAYEQEHNYAPEWIGKISLIYLSDYGYAVSDECWRSLNDYSNESCKNNNWLYKDKYSYWTMSTYSGTTNYTSGISKEGFADGFSVGEKWLSVYPVFYLKPETKITGGTGTASNPYTLSL